MMNMPASTMPGFDKHDLWFRSEVAALQKVLPLKGKGIEVGIGSGQFAKALGVDEGVEPSESMAALARQRGVKVLNGTAKNYHTKIIRLTSY